MARSQEASNKSEIDTVKRIIQGSGLGEWGMEKQP